MLCLPPAALNPSATPAPSPQPCRTRPSRAAGSCSHQPGYAYSVGTSSYRAHNTQDSFAVNLQGSLFDLPAGPLDVAVGGEYRRQKLNLTSNADPARLDTAAERTAYFAGLRGVQPSTLFYWLTNVGVANGRQTVKEAYAEVAVPILEVVPEIWTGG